MKNRKQIRLVLKLGHYVSLQLALQAINSFSHLRNPDQTEKNKMYNIQIADVSFSTFRGAEQKRSAVEEKRERKVWSYNQGWTITMYMSFHGCLGLSISVIHHWDTFITVNYITVLCCVYTGKMHHVIERVSHLDSDNCYMQIWNCLSGSESLKHPCQSLCRLIFEQNVACTADSLRILSAQTAWKSLF